jgi:hypothetical protein
LDWVKELHFFLLDSPDLHDSLAEEQAVNNLGVGALLPDVKEEVDLRRQAFLGVQGHVAPHEALHLDVLLQLDPHLVHAVAGSFLLDHLDVDLDLVQGGGLLGGEDKLTRLHIRKAVDG